MTSRTRVHRAPRASVAAVGVAALLSIVALSGCSPTDATDPAPSPSPSTSAAASPSAAPSDAAADAPCDLLDDATVAELIGEASEGTEVVVPGSEIPACQYGDLASVGLQVAQVPAADWARSLPSIVQTILDLPEGVLDDDLRAQLEDAAAAVEEGAEIEPAEACGYFSRLLEVAGQEPGTTRTVNYLPDQASAVAITGQQCESGTFSSLVVAREGIPDDELLVDQVSDLLSQLG
jgi:hypothetical protein